MKGTFFNISPKYVFCYFLSHFRSSKQWQGLNPQTWENKASDAPLCDCQLPSPSPLLNVLLFYSNNISSLIFVQNSVYIIHHFKYQQRCQGLSPQPWVDEMRIWPLCNCGLPSPSLALILSKKSCFICERCLLQYYSKICFFAIFYLLLGVQSGGKT